MWSRHMQEHLTALCGGFSAALNRISPTVSCTASDSQNQRCPLSGAGRNVPGFPPAFPGNEREARIIRAVFFSRSGGIHFFAEDGPESHMKLIPELLEQFQRLRVFFLPDISKRLERNQAFFLEILPCPFTGVTATYRSQPFGFRVEQHEFQTGGSCGFGGAQVIIPGIGQVVRQIKTRAVHFCL